MQICLGKWPHSAQNACVTYSATEKNGAEVTRAALDRYMFYCDRYMNHQNSLKSERTLYETVASKMSLMQDKGISWIEVQVMNKAVRILCRCRQVLMYTYSFAYFLEKNNQCIILEDNQTDLQLVTEDLSGILRGDSEDTDITPTAESLNEIKLKIQDKSVYCESRCQVLLEHVYEGREKGWWTFRNV